MERICIAALTFFNFKIYHTADSICIFVPEIVPYNKNLFIMNKYLKLFLNKQGQSKFEKPYLDLTRVSPRPHLHVLIWK